MDITHVIKFDPKTLKAIEDMMGRFPAQNIQPTVAAPVPPPTVTPVIAPVTEVPVAPVSAPGAPAVPTIAPTAAPTYSFDDLARAAVTLIDVDPSAREKIQSLLFTNYGVSALQELPEARRGDFANALHALGAKI